MKTLLLLLFPSLLFAQPHLQQRLDSLCKAGNFPGLSVAIVNARGELSSFTSGYADMEKKTALKPSDRLLQGSVGKTYVSAIALQLVVEGNLDLDKKVSDYLGSYDWYARIPNAADITVRQLMTHTSGVMRYEFKPDFLRDLTAAPTRVWAPADLLHYVLGEKASFAAGAGWEYSDTNYILLGMIMEQLTGKRYYDLLRQRILKPWRLKNTLPSDRMHLNGLVQGYAGAANEFGGKDLVLDEKGSFIINPQFEWTGGGIYSTTADLARWGHLLYSGRVIDTSLLLHGAVPAKLGRDTRYGLGVIIRPTPLGLAYGHSGFFTGYLTEMYYFPAKQICIAVQTNCSDFKRMKMGLMKVLGEMGRE